jgi:Kef-type K+ transport system membrane component KefB/voltage-gated potassium channel Kch
VVRLVATRIRQPDRFPCVTTAQIMMAAAIMLAVTGIALLAARRLHVGSIVALLAVGIALGPHSPYSLFQGHVQELEAIGSIGVILLLFAVALEVQPTRLWALRRMVAGFGAGQYFAATAGIMALALLLTSVGWNTALLLGLGLAMSSSAIALPLLVERAETTSPRGQAVVAVDIFQGFMVAPVLILVPVLAGVHAVGSGASRLAALLHVAAALAAVSVLALVMLPAALRIASRSLGTGSFSMLVLAGVLFASWIMDWAGVSAAMGAFLIGTLLSTSVFAPQIKAVVAPAKQVLLALFFMSIGMAIDPNEVFAMKSQLLLFLPALFVVKGAIGYAVFRAGRLQPRDAMMVALLLVPLDEIAFVIFAGARDNGLLDARGYAISLTVLSLSFVVSPILIDIGYRLTAERAAGPRDAGPPVHTAASGHVLQIGCGALGRALCSVLERAGIEYVCIDDDLDNLAKAKKRGHNVRFGHIEEPSSLWSFGVPDARLVILATDSFDYAKHVLGRIREFHPDVRVAAAARLLAQRDEFRALGARDSFALMPEGTLHFGSFVLRSLGVDEQRIEAVAADIRGGDYAALRLESDTAAG